MLYCSLTRKSWGMKGDTESFTSLMPLNFPIISRGILDFSWPLFHGVVYKCIAIEVLCRKIFP